MGALSKKAISCANLVNQQIYKQRFSELVKIGEFGFALMLLWNQIESAIKLVRYYDRISDGWPDNLDFLRASWKPLKELRNKDPNSYRLIFGKEVTCLYGLRNLIAHESKNVSISEFNGLINAARWVILNLSHVTPNLERIRERKRRSDAQLHRTS